MLTEIPILPLTEPERLWMQEVYSRNLSGQRFSDRDIWSILHHSLPQSFRPAAMDSRIVSAGGENIRLLGIVALQGNYTILPKVNQVITWIRKQLLAEPTTDQISTETIAQSTGLPAQEVHLIFQTVQEFGQFFRNVRTAAADLFITAIEVGGGQNVFYQYINYPGIEQLIAYKSFDQYRRPVEAFTFEEMQSANVKLDKVLEEIQKLKAGQEVIWTDIRQDIEELKALYSLGKKTWRQLLVGKITEMVASGVVSDTLSKAIEDMFKPEVSTFLPW